MLPLLISYGTLYMLYDTEIALYNPVQYTFESVLSTPLCLQMEHFNLTNLHSCQNLWILKDVTQSRGSSRYVSSRHATWEATERFPCLLLLLGL